MRIPKQSESVSRDPSKVQPAEAKGIVPQADCRCTCGGTVPSGWWGVCCGNYVYCPADSMLA